MDKWREQLDQAFGETPPAPADEYERILRSSRLRPELRREIWPAWLCAASLACALLVTVFVRPQTTTTDASTTTVSMLSVEMTSPYDESLDGLQDLADQIK